MIERWLNEFCLSSLQKTSLNRIDTNLVCAFVEKWHPKTSSFHMSFDKMKIALEDVSCLVHLSIMGDLWDAPSGINEESVISLAIDLLGVTIKEAT